MKTHVQNIYRKFGVHGRQELAALFAPAGGSEVAVRMAGASGPEGAAVSVRASEVPLAEVHEKQAALSGAIEQLTREVRDRG